MANQNAIRAALERLVERPNEDAFVIIQDKRTGKFVQFSGGKKEGLVFDLPTQPLAPEELTRAKAVLARYGIQLEEWEVYDRPGGKVVGTQGGFNKDLGRDMAKATEVTWAVLTEVYRFGDSFDMSIEEN